MNNILDLLYDYSKRGKNIDKEFINKVIRIIIREKELKEYIKRVSFETISGYKINHGDQYTPMAYNTYNKKIVLDNNKISFFQKMLNEIIQLDGFEQMLSVNAMQTAAILHETEHVNQSGKSVIQNEEFENLLLGICCHVDNEFLKESKVSQFLMLKRGIYLNPQLYRNLGLQQQLNNQFNTATPIERMANIHSIQEVSAMLAQISKSDSIENVILLFDVFLAIHQLNGYTSYEGKVLSPTERYLEEVKKLNIIGIGTHFTDYFDIAMKKAQNTSLESRLLLGLDINEEEYQQTEMRLSRKLK